MYSRFVVVVCHCSHPDARRAVLLPVRLAQREFASVLRRALPAGLGVARGGHGERRRVPVSGHRQPRGGSHLRRESVGGVPSTVNARSRLGSEAERQKEQRTKQTQSV